MNFNPTWIAIALSLLLAVIGGVGHVINYVLEQDTMTRDEIEAAFDDERESVETWVTRIAAQHDRDRSEIKESIQSVEGRVDNATTAIAGQHASIAGIDVHVDTIRGDLHEVKTLLDQLLDHHLDR